MTFLSSKLVKSATISTMAVATGISMIFVLACESSDSIDPNGVIHATTSAVSTVFLTPQTSQPAPVIPSDVSPDPITVSGQRFLDQGNRHIKEGASHPPYNSIPATSGWHYSGFGLAPAPWGVYDTVLEDEILVHNLEHGGIGIHYDCPNGCEALLEILRSVAQQALGSGLKVIMSPYPEMAFPFALTAWNYLDTFHELDLQRVKDFITFHHASGNAPEAWAP